MKNLWKLIIVIPIIVGISFAIWITFKNQATKLGEYNKLETVFGNLAGKSAEIMKFYTYGTSLDIEGKIKGVSKDNLEGIKLVLKDGNEFEKIYNLNYKFEENNIVFSSKQINNSINLDELVSQNKYYVQIRLKTNNSKDYKYYTLSNVGECKDIEYYTVTKDEKNNKVNIKFEKQEYLGKKVDCLSISVNEAKLPDDIYDIVIDSGHGGSDSGETAGKESESAQMLEYGKSLKSVLEKKGYKVKLTRDDSNTSSFSTTNMYDSNGRITIACQTYAKYMISLHTGEDGYSGIQVYIPNDCDISLAEKIANNLYNNSGLEYSNNNSNKKQNGIYQKNYTKRTIEELESSLKKKGIEPYNITLSTPRLYTIREVGGLATNAYVDGRNSSFGTNKYYNSNQGIECYQISIGSLKKEKDIIINEKSQIVNAIADAF